MYAVMKTKDIKRTLEVVNELNTKFPMMEMDDINFLELKKISQVTKQQFLSMIVFTDYMNKKGVHVNVYDIKKLQVKRNKEKWKFSILKNGMTKPLLFEHKFNL